jgi:hypothetical protein
MADIVPFPLPSPDPPQMCGYLEYGPFHVWPEDATIGDPCQCGAVRLSIDPASWPALIHD